MPIEQLWFLAKTTPRPSFGCYFIEMVPGVRQCAKETLATLRFLEQKHVLARARKQKNDTMGKSKLHYR